MQQLFDCDIIVADVSGNNPNVMWELGYAMALGKPAIPISTNVGRLPFNIREMRTIPYDARDIDHSLSHSLSVTIRRTLAPQRAPKLAGRWNSAWYLSKGRRETLYGKDPVELVDLPAGRVVGAAHNERVGAYHLEGTVGKSRIVTLTYTHDDPRSALAGGLSMGLDPEGKLMSGYWFGYLRGEKKSGGRVIWRRSR